MRRLIALVLLPMLLTACATEGGEGDAVAGNNRPAESSATAEPTEAAAEEPADDGILPFGETYTYEDGLSVTITPPEPYTPSESAAGAEGGSAAVAFTVTVVNNSGEAFDPSMFTTTAQSGNTEASEIFDSANEMNGGPSTSVLPGREAQWRIAYAVADPADIVMEVSPDFGEHEEFIYTNAA